MLEHFHQSLTFLFLGGVLKRSNGLQPVFEQATGPVRVRLGDVLQRPQRVAEQPHLGLLYPLAIRNLDIAGEAAGHLVGEQDVLPQAVRHREASLVVLLDAALDTVVRAGEDQLGGLNLTIEGLRRRDALVYDHCRRHRVPFAITLAGGYARRVDDTVRIHVNTILAAARD